LDVDDTSVRVLAVQSLKPDYNKQHASLYHHLRGLKKKIGERVLLS
jgi:hypothetical protein